MDPGDGIQRIATAGGWTTDGYQYLSDVREHS
jgi:hypothetical protein